METESGRDERPAAETTVHVLQSGEVNVDRAMAFREETLHSTPYTAREDCVAALANHDPAVTPATYG